jgi:acetyl esterase
VRLHPQVADYLEHRRGTFPSGSPPGEEDLVDRVDERLIGVAGIPIRVYAPEGPRSMPIVVYFHGGGWVMGDLEMHDRTCRRLSRAAGCVVVNVAYRLAPEYSYPIPMLDCYESLSWCALHASELNGDPAKLVVAGSSAGGNLAAAVALRARDLEGPELSLFRCFFTRCSTPAWVRRATWQTRVSRS